MHTARVYIRLGLTRRIFYGVTKGEARTRHSQSVIAREDNMQKKKKKVNVILLPELLGRKKGR